MGWLGSDDGLIVEGGWVCGEGGWVVRGWWMG